MDKREDLRNTIMDLVVDFLYYDRKEDDELTVKDMDNLTHEDALFIIDIFSEQIVKHIQRNK